jgi:stress response protein YsnF
MVVNKMDLIKNQTRIKDLLEKLRQKLTGFEVLNLRGQTLGRLKDFTLDKSRRLYMVIPELDESIQSPVYLLSSKYIQKVDAANRVLVVDISLVNFHQLPLYYPNEKVTEFYQRSPRGPVNQNSSTNSNEREDLGNLQPSNQSFTTKNIELENKQSSADFEDIPDVVEEQTIRLLEEKLIVNRSKRQVGEVVVRKVIETRFVEVPIQSEKLIIDKIGSESQEPVEVEPVPVDRVSNVKATDSLEHSPNLLEGQQRLTDSDDRFDRDENQFSMPQSFTTEEENNQNFTESENESEVAKQEIIRLLEERLVVNRSKWKVGEVVVRKEIENQIVQVPIRREKLIIEQVSPETKQLAEIDLGKGEVTGMELAQAPSSDSSDRSVPSADTPYTVNGEFLSPKAASHLLEAIALQGRHGCKKVRVELVLDDPEVQETYQTMFDRCSSR